MTIEIGLTLAVIVSALFLLAVEWLPADLLLLGALGLLTVFGVVDLESALAGFADPTLLAIGSLYVVAAGLKRTGVLRKAAHLLFGTATSLRSVLLRLSVASLGSSAFLNNTPVVAMGIPAVLSWSRERGLAPSRLLIPLSYASILGGVCTLIGTSTNLVADGMLRAEGLPGLGFFELAALGVPVAVLGVLYLVFVSPELLPDRVNVETVTQKGTLGRDIHVMQVPEGSPAVGRTVLENRLGTPELQLVRLVRDDGSVARIGPTTSVREGDRLTFRGSARALADTSERLGLEGLLIEDPPDLTEEADLREAVVAEGSELTGDNLREAHFADRYGATVLGVVRAGTELEDPLDERLRAGDVLLLVAGPEFSSNVDDSRNLHVLGGQEVEAEALSDEALWHPTRAKLGLAVLAAVVGLATTGVVHISLAALGGALAMVVAGFVSPADARRSIDWSVLIVIGSAIGLATALERSGSAGLVADAIVSVGTPLGPRGILAALLAGTMVFTLTITNNAAVAIAFPIAISVATSQGLDPRPLVITITVGASLAFATPLGYQTNLMVYGPGGYRFADFVRAGLPLQILLGILVVVLAPWIWPF